MSEKPSFSDNLLALSEEPRFPFGEESKEAWERKTRGRSDFEGFEGLKGGRRRRK
jgi:hypothetical protein